MSDHLDMQYDVSSYSPEAVGKMDRALESACRQVANRIHVDADIRQMLATSILEGVRLGMQCPEELVAFSLRSIPVFRIAEARTAAQ